MERLTELLNIIETDKIKGLINIDDWKWPDVLHLEEMGFKFEGDFHMGLDSPPMKIYKKHHPKGDFFYLEEEDKGIKIFEKFDEVIKYFDNYKQPEIDDQLS